MTGTTNGGRSTAWIGNSVAVAQKHYLQVTENDFAKAVQNPVQHVHAEARSAMHGLQGDIAESGLISAVHKKATQCMNTELRVVGHTGLEPVTVKPT